ncbi:MAG: succinylglutamate desuccinylase/aspartoacylase family protein [gamma proteobacterium symbiont of Bathyaustriella thionipta]|nr:succinylglutamate desuccinylase/aspartoacylase family protein [gamma proteobacterium symbiont of Bathyaustriella thionipta]MCU7950902.1 succinylglutamate desuccinylase/aspartoacylase family protein [gamma proteobacterium symbiont of Bathyaustriella thionipta]MCU7952648.1 succinylglutamate desuccinylase/aspartoacylase family protein [gamma proteobacterium symbiont of Bathyaustriella thionipta]MCU7955525.1 succinylglutamate desuccinylase/aspartoacylase family protein [gamma proteobacterium symb
MLTILDYLPEALLDKKAHELADFLSGPTLFHMPGVEPSPLFVSVLLHGNETTGWEAVKSYLSEHQQSNKPLPRAMSLFIGNIAAAREHKRVLPGQVDYNRIWLAHPSKEGRMMSEILQQMKEKQVFASIDFHNNTGRNPHYACVNRKEHDFFQLAHLFSRTVVYFIKPDTVQSMAFSKLCPAVTVECGQPEQTHGVEHAKNYLQRAMSLGQFSNQPLHPEDFDLYHTMVTVKVPEQFKISFAPVNQSDIHFESDVDRLNFTALEKGTRVAKIDPDKAIYLHAINEQGVDVASRYFDYTNGEIRTRFPVMPSMLTTKEEIIRQDCLCYLMERIEMDDKSKI